MPEISVCMPVYNGARFLPRSLATLASQTFKDFELVIIDDCSADDSASAAERLIAQHGFHGKVIRTENHGPEQARDAAIWYASAPVIAQFDCDDEWAPTYLEEMLGTLHAAKADLVYCDLIEEFPDGTTTKKSEAAKWIDLSRGSKVGNAHKFPPPTFFQMLLGGQVLFPPCTIYTRELYHRAGEYAETLPSLRVSLDWDFGLRASRLGTVAFLNRPLLRKHVRGDSVSWQNVTYTFGCTIKVLESVLADSTLSHEEREHALARAALVSSWASEKLRDTQQLAAIRWAIRSMKFHLGSVSAKALARALIPPRPSSLRS